MKRKTINVPAGVRYLTDWTDFKLPSQPTIINKQITGCGFTEYCICSNENIILCSPRKILLENKEDQHKSEVLYVRNEYDKVLGIDKDLSAKKVNPKLSEEDNVVLSPEEKKIMSETIKKLRQDISDYYYNTVMSGIPCKLLVTYDSFKHVKEVLGENIDKFYVVIDEFQSIFTDSRFKSDTEMGFLNHLRGLSKVSFVSATPMIEDYLDMLDDFKDLPYIDLDWKAEEPGRIINPQLQARPCQSINKVANDIIQTYLDGKFEKYTFTNPDGSFGEIESKELVIYVNSVKNICDIINKCNLTLDNTNVLCAKTAGNVKRIKKAFHLKKKDPDGIGRVPKKGEPHKMFTLCTRTVYLGADFYSKCARSLILSDANVECLAVDITLDLPQILGRQRLEENPWKNRAELYFKINRDITQEDFKKIVEKKIGETNNLISAYGTAANGGIKHSLASVYQDRAKDRNYKSDYTSVNTHGGSDLVPVFNNLVMISEMRAYEIQQIDYADRFSVLNTLQSTNSFIGDGVTDFLRKFDSLTQFTDKMSLLVNSDLDESTLGTVLDCVPMVYKNYIQTLGVDRIRALQYKNSVIKGEYERVKNNQNNSGTLEEKIYSTFKVGERYVRSDVKDVLSEIYEDSNIQSSPKASDLFGYFNIKPCTINDKVTGKRINGYEILSIKEKEDNRE